MPRRNTQVDLAAEPWWQATAPGPAGSEQERRRARARRLSQFRRDIARGPGLLMTDERLAYRRSCLERWRDYLDGWAPDPPIGDNGRPPKLPE